MIQANNFFLVTVYERFLDQTWDSCSKHRPLPNGIGATHLMAIAGMIATHNAYNFGLVVQLLWKPNLAIVNSWSSRLMQ